MDKKFRDLILSQVEGVVQNKPPSRNALYELLKIATPDLKLHAIDSTSQREHAFKALKILIHPDKHAKALKDSNNTTELSRVTKLFQETSAYYNLCCGTLAMESPNRSSSNSVGAPETFASRTTNRTKATTTASTTPTKHSHSMSPGRPPAYVVTTNSTSSSPVPPFIYNINGKLPDNFDAFQQWPHMSTMMKKTTSEDNALSNSELAWIMACRCINYRGAVVHGQKIGRAYQVTKKQNELTKNQTVQEVLQHFGFVVRTSLKRPQDIKREIIQNGPVVATSFRLKESFYQSHVNHFSYNQVHKLHPILLTGWCMTSAGELWKCQGLMTGRSSGSNSDDDKFQVGMGQFDIDKNVVAPPISTLETVPWQKEGPYLDLNMPNPATGGGGSAKDWRALRHMSISINAKELEVLGQIVPGGFQKAITNKTSFVIRDKHKLAYSRRYTLREVTTDEGKWKISVSQAESN